MGDVMAIGFEDELVAIILAYKQPRFDYLEGKLLAISASCKPDEQLWVLEHFRRWAASEGRASFGFPVDIADSAVAQRLQKLDFRLFGQSMLNMVKGDSWPPKGVHLVRFSG